MSSKIIIFFCYLLVLLLTQCAAFRTITHNTSSPREGYLQSLERSGLGQTSMAKAWIKAGAPLGHDSVRVTLPFQETGYFNKSEPQARFYRFEIRAGQVLEIVAELKAKEHATLFIDLFAFRQGGWKALASGDSLKLKFEFEKNETCLVRLQPELLVNLYYSINLSTKSSLIVPVKGATNKSIGSFYDDIRVIDGKNRKHEGLDIFAPKGTLVIAPTDGFVSRVGSNTLGGKTVWMDDLKRGHSYYFAHLDSQIVKPGTAVIQGDVLGTVGNTGNARNTPSHLHFGVFQGAVSKDPITYIRTIDNLLKILAPDTSFLSAAFRVNQKTVGLYYSPVKKSTAHSQLAKDTYLLVIGQSGEWYRVQTADEKEGFVEKNKVVQALKGNKIRLKKPTILLSAADREATPVGTLSGTIDGLAVYKNFRYIVNAKGQSGWIDLSDVF